MDDEREPPGETRSARGTRDTRDLPLFPLGTVLFPGAPLPLHIFEQRYRQMLARCLETPEHEFVVLLIREGDEVVERPAELPAGRAAIPHDVGTIARIVETEQLPDGRSLVLCQGGERVRLRGVVDERPYLLGRVEAYPDEDEDEVAGDAPSEVVNRATEVRRAAARLLAGIAVVLPEGAAGPRAQLDALTRALPAAPQALSFFVPRLLGSATPAERQTLLEAPSTRRRLEMELPLLFREQQVVDQLRQQSQEHQSGGGASPGAGSGSSGEAGRFGPIGRPSLN